jgi:S1-C subfamily serine protease
MASAVAGGLVVAGTLLVFGVTGFRTTQTVVQEAPVAASDLTPHAMYVRDAPAVVFLRLGGSTGSGFVVDRRGDILTSYQAIGGHGRIVAQFSDDVSSRAWVVAQDPDDGVTVLHADMQGVPPIEPLPLGDSATVRVGDPTLAIGNPLGYDRTLTSGIVSALQRSVRAPNGLTIDNVIQTDAPGSAGGPLLDAGGRVIGIVADGGATAFAVPIDTVKAVLARVKP